MSRRGYELSDFGWSVIEPLWSNKPQGFAYDSDGLRPSPAARGALANIKRLRNRLSPPPSAPTPTAHAT